MSENFGEVLKEYRERKGFTVNQLAQYSTVSASLISRIENGKRGTPKPETIAKLSKALKVDYDEMMAKAGHLDFDSIINDFEIKEEVEEKKEEEESPIVRSVQKFLRTETKGLTKEQQEILADDITDYLEFRKNKLLKEKDNK